MEPTSWYFFLSPLPPPLSCRGIAARRRNTSFRVKSISRSKCSRKLRTDTQETQDVGIATHRSLELCPSLTRLPVQRVHVRRHRNDFSLKRFRSVDSKTRLVIILLSTLSFSNAPLDTSFEIRQFVTAELSFSFVNCPFPWKLSEVCLEWTRKSISFLRRLFTLDIFRNGRVEKPRFVSRACPSKSLLPSFFSVPERRSHEVANSFQDTSTPLSSTLRIFERKKRGGERWPSAMLESGDFRVVAIGWFVYGLFAREQG